MKMTTSRGISVPMSDNTTKEKCLEAEIAIRPNYFVR